MDIENAVNLIRGQRGTKVKLEIQRDARSFFKTLLREKIELKTVTSKVNTTKNGFLIGYIRIKQFNANASKETKDAIKNLETKKVAGYVLDLRSNPGGLLESSIDISRQFVNQGKIVITVSKDGFVDGSGLTVTVAKYLTPNGTDINKSGIVPDVEVRMNINPIRQSQIGTRKDNQYRAGEKELINIIKRNNQISEFNPKTSNRNAFLNKEIKVYALN